MSTPADTLLRRVRSIGSSASQAAIEETFAACAEAQAGSAVSSRILRDRHYGPDERHRLDLHLPDRDGEDPAPVLIFVHGGGFVGGDKRLPNLPFYDHIGRWALARGLVGVTITYRLAPGHVWPAGGEDVGAAVAWLRANVAEHGGDPDGMILLGHSAGAAHVGTALTRPAVREALRGAAMLSGIYEPAGALNSVTTPEQVDSLTSYYGSDHSSFAAKAADLPSDPEAFPLLFGAAEFDWPVFQCQLIGALGRYLASGKSMPSVVWVNDHNHFSQVLGLGVDERSLAPMLDRFLARCLGAGAPAALVRRAAVVVGSR